MKIASLFATVRFQSLVRDRNDRTVRSCLFLHLKDRCFPFSTDGISRLSRLSADARYEMAKKKWSTGAVGTHFEHHQLLDDPNLPASSFGNEPCSSHALATSRPGGASVRRPLASNTSRTLLSVLPPRRLRVIFTSTSPSDSPCPSASLRRPFQPTLQCAQR